MPHALTEGHIAEKQKFLQNVIEFVNRLWFEIRVTQSHGGMIRVQEAYDISNFFGFTFMREMPHGVTERLHVWYHPKSQKPLNGATLSIEWVKTCMDTCEVISPPRVFRKTQHDALKKLMRKNVSMLVKQFLKKNKERSATSVS